MAEDRENLHTRERIVQQMSRDGLVEENITKGTLQNVSNRQADFSLSGEERPVQAHDRSQNKMYYQAADHGTEESGFNHAAAVPPAPDMEPGSWGEPADIPDPLEEFSGFAERIAQISSEGSEKELQDTAAENAGMFVDYKNRQMKKEIRREKERRSNQLHFEEDEEKEEETEQKEEEDGDGKEKQEEKQKENSRRLKEDEKEFLKFQREKETDPKDVRLKKYKKRLRFEEPEEEDEDVPHTEKNKEKETEDEEAEEEKENEGRLKFEDDAYGGSLKGRLAGAASRKFLGKVEEEQEEELDDGARYAYQTGKGTIRGAKYFSRRKRLNQLKAGTKTWEKESGRLLERGEKQQEKSVHGTAQGKQRLQDKSAASFQLKNGSRYLKNQEQRQDIKKKYQRKINMQKSMEIAQDVKKSSTLAVKAKAAAIKAAAALKGSILFLIIVLLFFILLLFVAGYLLLSLFHMGEAGAGAIYGGLYQSTYTDMTDCEEYYRELETDLEEMIAGIEEDTAYEDCYEFIYDLGNIGHRAVDLMSYLATKYTDFTLEMCKDELDALFEDMYTLEVEVKEEAREREKKDAAGNIMYDENGEPQTETFQAKICYVTLTVKPWEEIVEERLTAEETGRYEIYLMSQGGQQVYGNPLLEDWKDKISSPYGYRIHPITKVKTHHAGVDIAVPAGTPLFASTSGTVVTAHYSESAGNYIEVLTESGYTVRYLHLDSIGVSAGEIVEKGMLIGATGNTGRSTGPHLHLEIRTPEGNTIDPTFIVANGAGREVEEEEN